MCGIAGIIKLNDKSSNLIYQISDMSEAIKHRGPDDEGYLIRSNSEMIIAGGNSTPQESYSSQFIYSPKKNISSIKGDFDIALGHRRLSIIDLTAAGHQPMCSDDSNIWIVHNGEIYNFIELKNELSAIGYTFNSQTDTEVIIKSYQEWGPECVKKFNGMWAFAILDLKKKELFCSRDRFGIKPFYYYFDENVFAFASEIKALLALPFVSKDANDALIYNYLLWNVTEDGENTFYKNIKRLLHSHSMTLNLKSGDLFINKYYSLSFNEKFGSYDTGIAEKLSGQLLEKMTDAVRIRLRSDVPIGTCLSGGIDSSVIFLLINRLLKSSLAGTDFEKNESQKAFTSCFEDKKYDESHYARQIIDITDACWFKTFPTGNELWQDIRKLAAQHDEPFGGTSIYAQYRVMRLAHENNVKVMLDGQGGDELFGGYKSYLEAYLLDFFRYTRSIKAFSNEVRKIKQNSQIASLKGVMNLLVMIFIKNNLSKRMVNNLNLHRKIEFKYLNRDFVGNFKSSDKSYPRDISKGLNNILWQDMMGANLQKLLKWEDINSMAFAIESRTPFADDHELVEFVFSISAQYKIHDGWMKHILREAVNGILPESIRLRKDKIGFGTSEKAWLLENKKRLKDLFYDKQEMLSDYIDTKKIIKKLDRILDETGDFGISDFWRFINLVMWMGK